MRYCVIREQAHRTCTPDGLILGVGNEPAEARADAAPYGLPIEATALRTCSDAVYLVVHSDQDGEVDWTFDYAGTVRLAREVPHKAKRDQEILRVVGVVNAAASMKAAAETLGMTPTNLRGMVKRLRDRGWDNIKQHQGGRPRLPGPPV